MDPLTAFGVACNIMQVVSFSHEIFSLARRIAKDGSPDAGLVEKSARLSDLSQDLQGSLKTQQVTRPLTKRQQLLQEVAKKCLNSAESLAEELNKIKWKTGPSNSNPRTQRWLPSQTWKAWWGKAKIDKLQKEMTEIERSMQSTILVDLWLSQEATTLQHGEGFKSLDDRLQHFIRQYAQGFRQLSDLVVNHTAAIKEEVHSESAKMRAHVLVQLQAQEIARATMDEYKIFLNSLRYDSMNARKSQIDESYEKTFHWIFDKSVSHQWDNFLEWLKSDRQIYWISGKPGSGKSTLMKFLVNNQKTRDALESWKINSAIISFFLWHAGNPLQRSVKGLLCSLLQQLLMTDDSLITRLIAVQPELLRKKSHDDWSIMELESVLILAISNSKQPLCVFLDGLDEIDRDEGFHYLLVLIEKLRSNSSTKLCISSRPEPQLQDAFNRYPKLLIQDLTKSDISFFVTSFLHESNFHFSHDENVDNDKKRQQIVDEIIGSAHGVFLWVHLVVKSLSRGSTNFDSYEQILGRIRELPQTLEGLYKQAWDKLGEDQSRYRAEAARYFRLVLEARGLDDLFIPPFSLLDLSIAANDNIQSAFLEDKRFPPVTKLLENAMTCRRRIESRCCGLLEFWEAENESSGNVNNLYCQFLMPLSAFVTASPSRGDANIPLGKDLGSLWNIFYNVKVDFIHRTAADFLVEAESGRNIISSDPASGSDIRAKIFHSRLIRTLLFSFPWHIRGRHTNLDRLGGNISDEKQQQGIQVLVGDIYDRLLDRASVIEFIIKELRVQIRNGQFDSSFYKVLCDFTNSTRTKYFLHSRHAVDDDTLVGNALTKMWKTSQIGRYLPKACTQILVNYDSMSTDLWRDVNWPVEIPKIEVLCHADVSSDILWDRIFVHLLFTTWILVDARRCLRSRTADITISFLRTVLRGGLVEVAQRWFNARPGPYDGIPDFKEMLLVFPNNTPEMQDLLGRLLKSGVKVADPADWLDGRGHPSFVDDLEDYVRVNQRAIYKAVVSDLAESDDSEDDGSNSFY